MKNEDLIKLLKLPDPGAKAATADVESAIVAKITTLLADAESATAALAQENVIREMIFKSGGGLTRASALQVLKNREAYAKANPPKAPAKPTGK